MLDENEEFEAKSRQFMQRLQAESEQDETELREKYLALDPENREAFKRVVASLEEANDLLPRARFFNAQVQLSIASLQPDRVQFRALVAGLSAQLEEWEDASTPS